MHFIIADIVLERGDGDVALVTPDNKVGEVGARIGSLVTTFFNNRLLLDYLLILLTINYSAIYSCLLSQNHGHAFVINICRSRKGHKRSHYYKSDSRK